MRLNMHPLSTTNTPSRYPKHCAEMSHIDGTNIREFVRNVLDSEKSCVSCIRLFRIFGAVPFCTSKNGMACDRTMVERNRKHCQLGSARFISLLNIAPYVILTISFCLRILEEDNLNYLR